MAFHKDSQTSRWADFMICSTLVFLYTCFAKNEVSSAEALHGIEIHSSLDDTGSENHWFSVTGLPSQSLNSLGTAEFSTDEWQAIFNVSVVQPDLALAIEQPAMAGLYSVDGASIKFTPRFPPSPGTAYRATFNPKALPEQIRFDQKTVSRVFEVPKPVDTKPTSVISIYPSASVLPENLLKFYVHFSAPMSGDHVHRHIQLVDEKTGPVELPFLELDDALWNIDMTQLTLFIDPGRIKREVKPLEDIGPSMVAGSSYSLLIDENWLNARGNKLSRTYTKKFTVERPDRSAPKIDQWQLTLPRSGTRDPLVVDFGEPMDFALAQRMIRVETRRGKVIPGTVFLANHETEWKFVPSEPWPSGGHELVVQTTIEDLAGNNIGKLFEVDLRRETGLRPLPKFARRSFEIH